MTLQVDTSLQLSESRYFPEPQRKAGIAIHHTVCDGVRITMKLWRRDQTPGGGPNRVATAFASSRRAARVDGGRRQPHGGSPGGPGRVRRGGGVDRGAGMELSACRNRTSAARLGCRNWCVIGL